MWKEWKDISNGEAIDPEPYLRAALKHAMNTAVEEVTQEKQDEKVKIDENQTSTDVVAVGYNACRSDMEEKKHKFFNE
jgi:hypothetical protein